MPDTETIKGSVFDWFEQVMAEATEQIAKEFELLATLDTEKTTCQ